MFISGGTREKLMKSCSKMPKVVCAVSKGVVFFLQMNDAVDSNWTSFTDARVIALWEFAKQSGKFASSELEKIKVAVTLGFSYYLPCAKGFGAVFCCSLHKIMVIIAPDYIPPDCKHGLHIIFSV